MSAARPTSRIATTLALAMTLPVASARAEVGTGMWLAGPRAVTPEDGAAKRAKAQIRGRELAGSDPGAAGIHYDAAASEWGDAILYLDAADAYIAAAETTEDIAMADAAIERGHIALDLLYFQLDASADKSFRVVATEDIPDIIARANETIARAEKVKGELAEAAAAPPPAPDAERKRKPGNGKGLFVAGAVLTGLGAALAAVGGAGLVIGAVNQNKAEDPKVYGKTYDDVETRGRRGNVIAGVGLGIGGAALVAGVVMLVVGKKRKSRASAAESSVAFAPTTNGFSISGRF